MILIKALNIALEALVAMTVLHKSSESETHQILKDGISPQMVKEHQLIRKETTYTVKPAINQERNQVSMLRRHWIPKGHNHQRTTREKMLSRR